MKQVKNFLLFSILFSLTIGCQPNEEDLISNAYSSDEFEVLSANLDIPESPLSYKFGNLNSKTEIDHKGTFGRVLFYDKNLSVDGTVSCASCHQQALAFADDKAFSDGANGNVTSRNSIALGSFISFGKKYDEPLNEGLTVGLFWDERAASTKEQLKQTINNPNEMGMDLDQIVDLVESKDYYRVLHQKAFDSNQVTEDDILEALETFLNSIGSVNSRIETEVIDNLNYINGDSVVGEAQPKLGFQLFKTHCNSCHGGNLNLVEEGGTTEPLTVANNGLALSQNDLGVFEFTQEQEDIGKFKIPGLYNIELTAPYMHDGRFETLEEVVEFYNSGINFNQNLHPVLRDGDEAKRLNLSALEKDALVDFLGKLTDKYIVSEEKWSDPFVR